MARSNNDVTQRARETARNAADHFGAAIEDAGLSARQLAEDTSRVTRQQFNRAVDEASERGRAVYDRAGETAERQYDQLDSYVRDNPLKALGIAFGVGLFLGTAWRR